MTDILLMKNKRSSRALRGEFDSDEELKVAEEKCNKASIRYDREKHIKIKQLSKERMEELKNEQSKAM